MLFVTYWELNENQTIEGITQAAQKLTSSGLFPPENVTIIRWDSTPDNWGVIIMEADRAEDVHDAMVIWRASTAGFFKSTKTAPAMPVEEAVPRNAALLQALASA